jgi:hypothetical protein
MKRIFMGALVAVLAVLPGSAGACGLDDCALAHSLHLLDSTAPDDRFAWMNHDLALARDAMNHGNRGTAISLAGTLDNAMRARLDALLDTRGHDGVIALHEALDEVTRRAGGFPLAPLPIAAGETLARH